MSKVAKIRIANIFIRDALHLPDNAEIVHVMSIDSLQSEMIVQCDDFPEVESGMPVPGITPVFEKRPPVILKDWGFEK